MPRPRQPNPIIHAQRAGMLCNDKRFQRFAAERCGIAGAAFRPEAAAEYLRQFCGIASRCELDSNPAAQARFQILRTEFDGWTGKIATPR